MIDERIRSLLKNCAVNPPAAKEEIAELSKAVKFQLPQDYADLLAFSDGIEGFLGDNYVSIWTCEHVRFHGVYDFMPFLVFIGSNGGDEGYAYDTRYSPPVIVNVPFIGMDEKLVRVMGHSMTEFLERLVRAPLFPDP